MRDGATLAGLVALLLGGAAPCGAPSEDPAARPLSAPQRAALQAKLGELDALPAAERRRIEDLHVALSAEGPEGERYRRIFDDYRRWLDTLTPSQRRRVLSAQTPESRIEVVRELVEGQSSGLAKDLEPIEHDRRSSGSRRRSSYFARPPQEFLDVSRALAPKLNDQERKRYDALSMRSRFPLMAVLAAKYDVAGEGFLRDAQSAILESVFQIVDDPVSRFGAAAISELTVENRQKFVQSVVEMLLLPDIDRRARFAFLEQQPKEIKQAVDEISKRNPFGAQLLVNILYYQQKPDIAPPDLRDSLDVFSVRQAIERLSRSQGTNGEAPTSGRPNPPTRRFPQEGPARPNGGPPPAADSPVLRER